MTDKPMRTPLPEVRWRPWTKEDEEAEMLKPDPLVQMVLDANASKCADGECRLCNGPKAK